MALNKENAHFHRRITILLTHYAKRPFRIFGFWRSLADAGLVDEFRILVHPVLVAEGGQLFTGIVNRADLRLESVRNFEHGAIMVDYSVV